MTCLHNSKFQCINAVLWDSFQDLAWAGTVSIAVGPWICGLEVYRGGIKMVGVGGFTRVNLSGDVDGCRSFQLVFGSMSVGFVGGW